MAKTMEALGMIETKGFAAMVEANTESPALKRVTFLPTASTSPASSIPKIGCFGFVKPNVIRAGSQNSGGTVKLRIRKSPALTVVACTLIRISLSFGAGFCTSVS